MVLHLEKCRSIVSLLVFAIQVMPSLFLIAHILNDMSTKLEGVKSHNTV